MNDNKALSIHINMHTYGWLRSVIIDRTPWFIGTDITTLLGFANPDVMLANHVDEENKQVRRCKLFIANGGEQDVLLINEKGVSGLLSYSNPVIAKEIQRWMTDELYPSLYGYIEKERL